MVGICWQGAAKTSAPASLAFTEVQPLTPRGLLSSLAVRHGTGMLGGNDITYVSRIVSECVKEFEKKM